MARHGRLAVLAVVALALCAALAIDLVNDTEPPSVRVFPELAGGPQTVQKVTIRAPHKAPVVLARDHGALVLTEPAGALTDGDAARALAQALEVLTVSRRFPADSDARHDRGLDAPVAVVTVEIAGHAPIELAIGGEAAAHTAVWAHRAGSDEDVLIDAYAARELYAGEETLRSHDPVPVAAASAERIEIAGGGHTLVASGSPLAVDGSVRLAEKARTDLLAAIDDLTLRSFVDPTIPPPALDPAATTVAITVDGTVYRIRDAGVCPSDDSLRRVTSAAGSGCIEPQALTKVARFLALGDGLYDRSLIAARQEILSLEVDLADHHYTLAPATGDGVIRVAGKTLPAAAEPVAATLARLASAASGPFVTTPASSSPAGHITITYRSGARDTLTFARAGNADLVRRNDEPVWIFLAPGTLAALSVPAVSYRSRQVLFSEPTALRTARRTVAGKVVEDLAAGQLIGELSARVPDGAEVLPSAQEALRAVANLRANRVVAAAPAPRHRLSPPRATITLSFAPPPIPGAAGRTVDLVVGARTQTGCYAKRGDLPAVFELDRKDCRALLDRWTKSVSR